MTPASTESTTARATAACAGPNIWTACLAPLMVTLLNMIVSGFAGRFGATTASRVVKPSLLLVSALQNAAPAGPDFEPMIRSMCATSLPSPTSDSPRKKSAISRAPVRENVLCYWKRDYTPATRRVRARRLLLLRLVLVEEVERLLEDLGL